MDSNKEFKHAWNGNNYTYCHNIFCQIEIKPYLCASLKYNSLHFHSIFALKIMSLIWPYYYFSRTNCYLQYYTYLYYSLQQGREPWLGNVIIKKWRKKTIWPLRWNSSSSIWGMWSLRLEMTTLIQLTLEILMLRQDVLMLFGNKRTSSSI